MVENVDTLEEIYMERARYLLNMDELLEEMYGKSQGEITDNMKVEFGKNEGTLCCGALVDTEVHGVEMRTSEQIPVCSNNCRKFFEMAKS
jgi:hypothetical protein